MFKRYYKNSIFIKTNIYRVQSIIDEITSNYPYEKRLWDLSKIKFKFTSDEIRAISEYGKSKFPMPNKLAIIATDELVFGEMRMFEVYREQEGHTAVCVFRTEPEALEWLG